MLTGARNSVYVFLKNGYRARLLVVLFVTFQISSCGFSRPIIRGIFVRQIGETSYYLEKEVQNANQSANCLARSNDPSNIPESLHASGSKITSVVLIRALWPALVGRRLAEVKNTLAQMNASCRNRAGVSPDKEGLLCDYDSQYILGVRGLYVLGWHFEWARLQIDKFTFSVISKRGYVSDVIIDNIDGECYEIDKAAFENAEQIIKTKRVYW